MKPAISYLRFSSKKQSYGDSYRRQIESTEKYCAAHDLKLSSHLEDLGVSAWSGKNLEDDAALGGFLKLVEAGKIPKGTVLIVENLDRLSRAKITTALTTFLNIIKQGIEIVTTMDGKSYTEESVSENPMDLMISITYLTRGNNESETKSKRIREAWTNKVLNISKGNFTKHSCPLWLKHDGTKYILIQERAEVVQTIFDLYNKGYGCVALIHELNKKNIKPFGRSKGWQPMTVYRMLESKSTIGYNDFVKPAIKDYYPLVITEDIFYKAQLQRQKNHSDRGRRGDVEINLYGGLCKCSHCGGSMVKYYVNGTGAMKNKRYTYLRCFNNKIGICKSKMTRFEPFNETFLVVINSLDFTRLLFTAEPKKDNTELLRGKIAELDKTISRVSDLVIKSDNAELGARLTQLEIDRKQLKKDLEAELGAKAGKLDTLSGYRQFLHTSNKKLEEPEFRMALRTLIKKHIKMIVCSPNQFHICLVNDNNLVSVTLNKPKMTPFGIAPSYSLNFGKWNPDETPTPIIPPLPAKEIPIKPLTKQMLKAKGILQMN